jgi:diguanylate cyclase (GGDEF)-like protein
VGSFASPTPVKSPGELKTALKCFPDRLPQGNLFRGCKQWNTRIDSNGDRDLDFFCEGWALVVIKRLSLLKLNILTASIAIAASPEPVVHTKRSIDLPSRAERRLQMFHQELIKQNEKHLAPFIVAICFAIIAYIGYDYLTLPLLWSHLVVWRLLAVLCGIAVIVLFVRERISGLTAWAIFFTYNALTLGYFISLYDDPIHLIAGNVNLSVAMFILPLALLTYPPRFSISMTLIFITNYLFWNILYSPFSLSDILIYGGAFNIFAILVSLFGHWSKTRSLKRIVELNLIIETKNQEILEQNRKLELQATYDTLTGAYNRGFGLQILEDRIRLTQRDGLELTIVYIDVDNLKTTNDSLGHKYGDQLILGIVKSIRSEIRDADLVCRLGGDEFLLVMNNCDLPEANRVMSRICAQLELLSRGSPFPYEISWGVLRYSKDDFPSLNEFIERADQIMYKSKQAKKNLRQDKDVGSKG